MINEEILSVAAEIHKGFITGLDDNGMVLVQVENIESSRSCFLLQKNSSDNDFICVGDKVLFALFDNDQNGYILGIIKTNKTETIKESKTLNYPGDKVEVEVPGRLEKVNINGKRISIEAEEELTIKCGKGSILIDKQGKIVVRGTNLISRSSGNHKIKGASVSIN